MSSMPPLSRRRLLFALATTAALPALAAAPFTLDELMRLLSGVKSGEARFTESRRVSSLDQSLQSSGRLSFTAPDVFVRETLKPRPEKLAVNGNTLTMTQGTRNRTLQLDTVPEAQVMIEAIRGTLTGNGATLLRYFETRLDGDAANWRLVLLPKDARLRDSVREIDLQGQQGLLREIRLHMADGDTSVTTIEPVSAASAASR